MVRDWAHVAAHNIEISILADVVDGHLKHAEMEVGYGAERSTRDKDDGLLIWMALKKIEAVVRKRIAWRRGEARGQTSNVLLRRCGHGGRRYGEI